MQIQTHPPPPETKPRLPSLDALRGFDMFWIIEVWGLRRWSFFFRVIGLNSIFIYLVVTGNLVNLGSTANSLFGWLAQPLGDPWGQLVMACGNLAVAWGLLYFMYRQKIFLKV